MTRTQALIWTSQRLHPDSPLANMGKRSRIEGPLDPARFVEAFDAVVRRAELLRAVVVEGDAGVPHLDVLDDTPRSTEIIDLPAGELEHWCDERIAVPIDATSCMYDSVLLRHGPDRWTWWLDLHHLATDAWSSALVFEATSAAYDALSAASPSGSAPNGSAPSGPVDDAISAVLDGSFHAALAKAEEAAASASRDTFDERAAAWAADLAPAEPFGTVAPYGSRGPRTTAVERIPVPLDADVTAALDHALQTSYRTISRELGLLTISAMATAITLHRLDGRRTLLAGVPVHHRSSRHTRRSFGPMMELYPLVITVEPAETHAEMFARTLRSITDLLRRAKPGESPDAPFEVVLNVLTARYGDFAGLPTTTEWMRSGHVEPNHVLRAQVFDYAATADGSPGELHWELDVNESLVPDRSPARLAHYVSAAVASIARTPEASSVDVDLIDAAELDELALLEPQIAPRPPGRPVHEQIADRLRADPESVVVEHGAVCLTASEFDRRADEVCSSLLRGGITPGHAVGLRMGRGVDVLVAMHGVLRAGAAFVMLSPDDPPARHEAIARDADLFDIFDTLPSSEPDAPAPERPAVGPDDLAYILYTSGSTGQPKGVPITHRGLADYLAFAVEAYTDSAVPPVVALHSSLVFDLTITSLFVSFLTGGRLVVFDADPVTALGQVAIDDRISWLKATPSQLEIYNRLAAPSRSLRNVVVGGEAFRRPVAEQLREVCGSDVRIFNEYGPTEAVVGCMIHEWDPVADTGADVPIGHAAPGTRLVVLDEAGSLAPSGTWGELYVQRPGMAAGYLHLPEETAERFVLVDVPDHDGVWYRTGDRVRVERPGVLTYGGRIDDQMKVDGVRLEPAEVESALVAVEGVSSALVRVWQPADHPPTADDQRCRRCGLGIEVPGTELDAEGICQVCRTFDEVAPQAERWFRTAEDLDAELADARWRRRGDIDCLHLLSGGKDSTYALYQLVERGWKVHALTLDNGFISEGAKENVRRSIADLGITHEFATTEAMNEIFRDSLDRYSNVCQGCYKTIYTLAVARAREMGIPVIVTGLSRGQFFETRLVPHQFEAGRFDPDEIDRTVLEARKVYHHTPDAVTKLLPEQRVFDDDTIFDEVRFVDFYRYVDVDLAELYDFLEHRAPWVRPADTGRSTNCLINVAGIDVHTTERGYHNYAEPYAWDVRLGHKTRAEALEELDDVIDPDEVSALLEDVGYLPKSGGVLTAWYVSDRELDPADLRSQLRRLLPEHAIPSAFVRIDEMPLAASAKADASLLPAPTRFHRAGSESVPPSTDIEAQLVEIWARVLGLDEIGVTDDFFDLGGASLSALEAVAAVDAAFATDLPDAAVFRHRTVRELATRVELELAAPGVGGAQPIPPLPAGAPAPLSAGEEALLFDYRLDTASARHSVIRRYIVDGALDADRFEGAVRLVAMAHTPLHTSYSNDRRKLVGSEAVAVVRLPQMSRDDFDRFADVQRTVPFDLDAGPLVRVHLAPIDDGAHTAVLLALHHISVDAATFDLLWDQLVSAYEHGVAPELKVTAAAHAAWQRERDHAASREYWLDVAGSRVETGRLRLPAPTTPEPDGYLAVATSLDARTLSVEGATPFATAMAATALTLSAFTARQHVEFGVTFSTKDHPDVADLVGYYLNTVPMALTVTADGPVRSLLEASSETIADVIDHRTYPFASIVRDARGAGFVAPNVSAMLAYEQLAPATFAGGVSEQRFLPSGVAVTDVTFFVHERPGHVELGLEYRGSVVGRDDAERLLGRFEQALEFVTRAPDSTARSFAAGLGAPDLVGESLDPVDATVLERIIGHAADDPRAVAVVTGSGQVSRGALAAAVADTVRRLDEVGLGRGARIGLEVGRTADLVVAVLAVQAVGAAYVPLDPQVPLDRRRRIASTARLDGLVVGSDASATRELADLDVAAPAVSVVSPGVNDVDPAAIDALRARVADVQLDDTAYVIFTSGSTGAPRGVEVSHRNLASSTMARDPWYGSGPRRFLLTSSIGFDSSIVGLFWPLTSGGAIVLPDDRDVGDVDRLGQVIEQHDVSHVLMVPSLYAALLDRSADRMGGLEVAIVAGEACPPAVVAAHHQRLRSVDLVNEYGPTETTVWATAHRLDTDDPRVPIGAPIPGMIARVVDDRLLSTPPGVAGELLLAGPGVTSGYLDDPVSTAARFVDGSGTRWYRTGDTVRVHGDVLEFVGRIDDQLNVGGVRLEPRDVEGELRRLPLVRDAVVVAVGSPARLIAHVEVGPVESDALDEAAIRESLGERLPASMVPRRFIPHRELPRNVHGKIDRTAAAALAVPSRSVPAGVQPSHDAMQAAVEAWQQVLDLPDADADTDFFTTGGDSLAAVEIVNRLGAAVGRSVPIAALLDGRTPRGLAALLAGNGSHDAPAGTSPVRVVPLREGAPGGPLVVMCAAWDDVFGYRSLAQALPDDIVVTAVAVVDGDGTVPVTTVDGVVERAEAGVRAAIDDVEPSSVVVLGWSVGGVVAAELAERLLHDGIDVRAVALVDTYFPGQEQHLWSNRWWKYKSLLRPGAFGQVITEFSSMGRKRVQRLVGRFGRMLLRWSGSELPEEPATVGGFPAEAFQHRIERVTPPLWLYRADTTNPSRNVVPWGRVADELTVIEVSGRHRGYDSVMEPPRVTQIVDDLTSRLR